MSFMKKLSYSAATFALLAAAPAAVYAQETAASLRGTVVDADGAPVSGATVTIVHAQSGTASTTTTGSTGAFFQSGLRVGGPYTITVSAPSFEGEALSDLYLRPGSQAPLSIALNPTTTDVIVVTGLAVNTLDLNNGVGSSYSASDIANQPATSRDVLRTLARDPLAIVGGGGSLSVAGSNPRFNGLAIDGSLQQDDFGLGSSTYATARSPINLDAIESASVAASDYSVTVGNFVGGLVNVVTRSGTNEFDGSAFYYRQDEDFIGNASNGAFVDQPPFTEEEYGVTLGGPIIEDRLFFFVSYDKFESGSSSNFTVSDAQNGVDPAFFTALADMVQTATGYDMGDRPLTVATPVLSERYLAKLDWNINDDHRLSFTYQQTEEGGTSNVSSNNFSTAWYDTPTELTAYTVQLFSDWTPNLSTTLRANFKDYMRGQDCRAGTDTPQL
ncbi:MAG: TonB-dependent receptor, partial [Maricaulis sp.]